MRIGPRTGFRDIIAISQRRVRYRVSVDVWIPGPVNLSIKRSRIYRQIFRFFVFSSRPDPYTIPIFRSLNTLNRTEFKFRFRFFPANKICFFFYLFSRSFFFFFNSRAYLLVNTVSSVFPTIRDRITDRRTEQFFVGLHSPTTGSFPRRSDFRQRYSGLRSSEDRRDPGRPST